MPHGSKKISFMLPPRTLAAYRCLTGVLAVVLAVLVNLLAWRINPTHELSLGHRRVASVRMENALAETQGSLKVTCFLSSTDPRYRAASRLLRGIQAASRRVAGARIDLAYVDPRRDIDAALRFVKMGVRPGTIVFESGWRHVAVPLEGKTPTPTAGFLMSGRERHAKYVEIFHNESACASAIQRLLRGGTMQVGWLTGHGELRPDDFDVWSGCSIFADALRRHGFELSLCDLVQEQGVPQECDILAVVGPRTAFAVEEREWIDKFLNRGGRVLYFANAMAPAVASDLFLRWGVRISGSTVTSPRTLSGAEIVVRDFADHEITRSLGDLTLHFGPSRALELSEAVLKNESEALSVLPLVKTDESAQIGANDKRGPFVLAVAIERGGNVATGLAYRSARAVIIGNAACASNGTLNHRAAANMDFLLNTMNWLAGYDSTGGGAASGQDAVLLLNFTRLQWLAYLGVSSAGLIAAFLLLRLLVLWRRA